MFISLFSPSPAHVQCIIDLSKNVLRVGTTGNETPFLDRQEAPDMAAIHQQEEVSSGQMHPQYCTLCEYWMPIIHVLLLHCPKWCQCHGLICADLLADCISGISWGCLLSSYELGAVLWCVYTGNLCGNKILKFAAKKTVCGFNAQ